MSVINEMLKDLDKRKSNEQPTPEREVYLQASKQGVDYKLLIIAVLLTGIVSVAVMSYLQSEPVSTIATDSVQAPLAVPAKSADKQTAKVITPELVVKTINASSVQESTAAVQVNETTAASTQIDAANKIVVAEPEAVTKASSGQVPSAIITHKGGSNTTAQTENVEQTPTKPLVKAEASLTIAPVELSPKQLADKKYKQAERAIKDKKAYNAEQLLEEALILSPKHVEARKQLAALWFGRQANGQAINVLAQGIALTPNIEELRIMQARIYANQADFNKALKTLLPLSNSSNSEYQQALATMASQSQQFPEAIAAYQKLIVLNPEQGRWWLGLAIALDSNAQYQQAQLAYQKALSSKQLSQSSENFVKTRLMELGE